MNSIKICIQIIYINFEQADKCSKILKKKVKEKSYLIYLISYWKYFIIFHNETKSVVSQWMCFVTVLRDWDILLSIYNLSIVIAINLKKSYSVI